MTDNMREDSNNVGFLILPEIKEIYKGEETNSPCYYNGCGADDGWPEICMN